MTVVATSLTGVSGGGGGGSPGAPGVGFRAPVAVAYAAALTLDCTSADTFNVGALTGPLTLNLSGAVDGQKIMVNLPQDGTGGRLVTFGTSIVVSADLPAPVLSTGANKGDALGFTYHGPSGKYRFAAFIKGY